MIRSRTATLQRTALVLCAGLVMACASSTRTGDPIPTRDRNMIVRAELATRASSNLHEIVNSLRPNWLRPPLGGSGVGGRSSNQPPVVYLDGRRFGELEALRTMSAESAETLRYLSVTEAQSKFGSVVTTPVIEVFTRGR